MSTPADDYDRIKAMLERAMQRLQEGRRLAEQLDGRMDMARRDAEKELVREVEEFLREQSK